MGSTMTAEWIDRLRARSTEILIVLAVLFIGYRLLHTSLVGRAAVAKEEQVLELLTALHEAQASAVESSGRFAFLPELIAASAPTSLLRQLERVERVETPDEHVDLYRAFGYDFATFVVRPMDLDVEQVWSASHIERSGSSRLPGVGYGAFAWPDRVSDTSRWAFYVSHRGKQLGSFNLRAELDGTAQPFPPTVRPLRSFVRAQKEGDLGEWVLFEDLGEIAPKVVPPGAERARD